MKRNDGVRFSHIGIYVHDVGRMEQFYVGVLEFTVTDRGVLSRNGQSRTVVFLSRDPDEHHQIVLASGRPAALEFNPINQISMRVETLDVLYRFHERFHSAGCAGIEPVSHGNAVSFYALDPEGNRLEVYWDTPWYVSQPLVQPIDLSLPETELLALLESRAREMPGFRPKAQWRDEMVARMQR